MSGLMTAVSLAAVTGLAASVGIVIAREFGRTAETDGFFAAYSLFAVLLLAASAFRAVALPALARARLASRLAAETVAYGVALLPVVVPALAVSTFASDWVAARLTGGLPVEAREAAATALVWLLPGAVAHLYAGIAASALAAVDDYATAAVAYVLGSAASLALILWRLEDGIVALSWGLALNGLLTCGILVAVVAIRGRRPGRLERPVGMRARLLEFGRGIALPLALQVLFVVCLRVASGLGVGAVTSFSYAYLLAAALVAVTASSLSLVSSVPLTRIGLEGERAARHIVSSSWLALAVLVPAAGVFALAGETILPLALGGTYTGALGTELGRLVVYLTPWAVVSVGLNLTFPLLFVAERDRPLGLVAVGAIAIHVPVALAGRELGGLAGIALAIAVTTALVAGTLLAVLSWSTLRQAARGLGRAGLVVGAVAAAAFGTATLLLDAVAAAALGLGLYALVLGLLRPRGLAAGWAYLRALR
jgi:hypothetical protein